MVEYTSRHLDVDGFPKPLKLTTADDVLAFVREHQITSIRLWFTDILGNLKTFEVTPAELPGAFEEGMGFDGSSIHGYQRIQESDMVAIPLAETAQFIPFQIGPSRCLRMFAEVRKPDGSPYAGDPRNILRNQLARLDDFGFTHMNVGPEAEFFYFRTPDGIETLDDAGYFDLVPSDAGDDLREATHFALEAMGIPVEYSHHEVAPSQHEIDLKYDRALEMADKLQTYKWLVKEIARRNGVHATFMPKPLSGENGSGMHTHLSIFDGDRNCFYDTDDAHHLSPTAKHFIAGVLDRAREMCMITNQSYNSYKRLVPGYEAPVYITWAEANRSALVRIPLYKPGKEVATRMELRFPDAVCNPYLAFAAMLAAGLEGVSNKADLRAPSTEDLYHMSEEERAKQGIDALPHDLYEAVKCARGSEYLRGALGEGVVDKLVDTKMAEYDGHRLHVSSRELEESLKL
ncbi:MAG: glutamine synthetase [Acidobacteria bacterium]|nr:glutamine synthetase [Acidobacteriota bacterium]